MTLTFWDRWRIPIMLAPTMSVIIFLFIGGLLYGTMVSLGWQPLIGRTEISLRAYQIFFFPASSRKFLHGLVLTIWSAWAARLFRRYWR